MHPHKIVNQPVPIQCPLQVPLGFGVSIRLPSKRRITAAQGGIKGFDMIGMNRRGVNHRFSLGMFRHGCLILGAWPPPAFF